MNNYSKNHWTKRPDAHLILARIKKKLKGRPANKGSFQKGHKNSWEGKKINWVGHNKPHTIETKKKISKSCTGKNKGKGHYAWKGDMVGDVALHSWVKRQLGFPMKCEFCGFIANSRYKIHWANKSHKYKRDVKDWIRLCVPCHKRYDLDFINK